MENIKQQAGLLIWEARMAKGSTQEELAEKMGLNMPTINKYESGRHNLTIETLRKVIEARGLFFCHLILQY